MVEVFNIKGHVVKYEDVTHTYLCDGILLPSITQILKKQFPTKYDGIPSDVLKRASIMGTKVHNAVQRYCEDGIEEPYEEVQGFKSLMKFNDFYPLENEVVVLLFDGDTPIACGRLDMVIYKDGKSGIADIKRTSKLDRDYLGYQLNLYRIAYQQSYDEQIDFLVGLHLREKIHKYVDISIDEEKVKKIIKNI